MRVCDLDAKPPPALRRFSILGYVDKQRMSKEAGIKTETTMKL